MNFDTKGFSQNPKVSHLIRSEHNIIISIKDENENSIITNRVKLDFSKERLILSGCESEKFDYQLFI